MPPRASRERKESMEWGFRRIEVCMGGGKKAGFFEKTEEGEGKGMI